MVQGGWQPNSNFQHIIQGRTKASATPAHFVMIRPQISNPFLQALDLEFFMQRR